MEYDRRPATVEELWERLWGGFLLVVDGPYRPIAEKLQEKVERLIAASQKLAGIVPGPDAPFGDCYDVMPEQDAAIAVMLFEQLAARFSEHGAGISPDLFKTSNLLLAFIAEMQRKSADDWQEEIAERAPWESSYECWTGLRDRLNERVLSE